MPKVSVVVPIYNVESYLTTCIDSLLNQTLEDIEIICVNDGSTDSSPQILEEYAKKDKRIKYITKENSGYGHTMNVGIDAASSEYIGILESDDYVSPNMFEELYSVAKANDLDFVKSDFYRFTEKNGYRYLQRCYIAPDASFYNRVLNPCEELETFRFIMNTWTGIYKKSFLTFHNIRHNETAGASFQDNGFWFKTSAFATRAMFVDKAYYRCRRDNVNSSVHSKTKIFCAKDEYDYIGEFLKSNPQLKEKLWCAYQLKRFHNYRFTCDRIGNEYKEMFIKQFSLDFNESEKNGELNTKMFSDSEVNILQLVMSNPQEFYNKFYNNVENELSSKSSKIVSILRKGKHFAGRLLRSIKHDGFSCTLKKINNFAQFVFSKTKLSIILTVYNEEQFLDECMQSILSQTFAKFEVICVDDGSTDNSFELLTKWKAKDKRVKILQQKNSGAGVARNLGLQHAKGKYLLFLDSDDIFENEMFRILTKKALITNSDITICDSYKFDNTSKEVLPNQYALHKPFSSDRKVFSRNDIPDKIFNFCIGWAWDKLYKRSFVRKSKLKFQALRTTNDAYFVYLSLVKASRISIVDEKLVLYRNNNPSSLAQTRVLSWDCFYKAIISIRDELKNLEVYDQLEQSFANWALDFSMWNYYTLAEPTKTLLRDKLRESYLAELGLLDRPEGFFYENRKSDYELMQNILNS
ncbi:MAG: glycosyltransferase [Clostridia bacterium]|nr:glycosyltransferase [Clostridia bacterium]